MAPTFMLFRAKSTSRFFNKYQALTPVTNRPLNTQPLKTVWKNLFNATGESKMLQKSIISFRTVSGLNSMPTGYCIHAFATRIHKAEMVAPKTVNHVEA